MGSSFCRIDVTSESLVFVSGLPLDPCFLLNSVQGPFGVFTC